jgi:arylsulfatase A-like enzyme
MLVPLLLNRPAARAPRRTVDAMPSALIALGISPPKTLDGVSFL